MNLDIKVSKIGDLGLSKMADKITGTYVGT